MATVEEATKVAVMQAQVGNLMERFDRLENRLDTLYKISLTTLGSVVFGMIVAVAGKAIGL